MAAVELLLGDLLERSGNTDSAAAHRRSAVSRLQAFATPGNHPVLTMLARLQLRLGQLEESNALAARLRESKYRHPAYAEFVNELGRGVGTRPVRITTKEKPRANVLRQDYFTEFKHVQGRS